MILRRFWVLLALTAFAADAQDSLRTIPVHLGDVLFLKAWRHPNLSARVEVHPDGNITLPSVGEIRAEGLNLDELQQRCEMLYARYFQAPAHVSLFFVKSPNEPQDQQRDHPVAARVS